MSHASEFKLQILSASHFSSPILDSIIGPYFTRSEDFGSTKLLKEKIRTQQALFTYDQDGVDFGMHHLISNYATARFWNSSLNADIFQVLVQSSQALKEELQVCRLNQFDEARRTIANRLWEKSRLSIDSLHANNRIYDYDEVIDLAPAKASYPSMFHGCVLRRK